ncbi:MAG TPA: histidine phosphatase family protein [Acidimicrobiales bacterium]|jgi:probable phosphoglycerate mutase
MDLLLIRHALPIRIDDGEGPADPELSDEGWRQAGALAAWLADEEIEAMVASPLRRAQETAEPLATLLDLEVTTVDGLAEFDRDAPWYIPIEELKAADDPRWHALVNGDYQLDPHEFQKGVVEAVDGVIAAHPGRTVAAVCHGGTINAYLSAMLGIDRLMFFFPEYTSVSRVRASRSGVRGLVSINETSHLRFAHRSS